MINRRLLLKSAAATALVPTFQLFPKFSSPARAVEPVTIVLAVMAIISAITGMIGAKSRAKAQAEQQRAMLILLTQLVKSVQAVNKGIEEILSKIDELPEEFRKIMLDFQTSNYKADIIVNYENYLIEKEKFMQRPDLWSDQGKRDEYLERLETVRNEVWNGVQRLRAQPYPESILHSAAMCIGFKSHMDIETEIEVLGGTSNRIPYLKRYIEWFDAKLDQDNANGAASMIALAYEKRKTAYKNQQHSKHVEKYFQTENVKMYKLVSTGNTEESIVDDDVREFVTKKTYHEFQFQKNYINEIEYLRNVGEYLFIKENNCQYSEEVTEITSSNQKITKSNSTCLEYEKIHPWTNAAASQSDIGSSLIAALSEQNSFSYQAAAWRDLIRAMNISRSNAKRFMDIDLMDPRIRYEA